MATRNDKDVLYAGNKRILNFTVTDAEDDDAPFDLTGYTVKWALARYRTGIPSETAELQKTSADSGQINIADPTTGVVQVILAQGDTTDLLGTFYQQLEIFDGSGNGLVVAYGDIEIRRHVAYV